jgi:hypothetical protein
VEVSVKTTVASPTKTGHSHCGRECSLQRKGTQCSTFSGLTPHRVGSYVHMCNVALCAGVHTDLMESYFLSEVRGARRRRGNPCVCQVPLCALLSLAAVTVTVAMVAHL